MNISASAGRRRTRTRAAAAALVLIVGLATVPVGLASASPGQSVTSLRDVTPRALGRELVGSGVTLRQASFTGDDVQAGIYRLGAASGVSSARGVVLSSGSVVDADPQSASDTDFTRSALLGPNSSLTTTGDLGLPGDGALTELTGVTTYDAAILTLDVVPRRGHLQVSYVFGSEEYAIWGASGFADAFAIWIDGVPCSFVPGTDDLVGTSTVNATTNSGLYVPNFAPNDPGAGTHDTEMNAFTSRMTCSVAVAPRRPVEVRVAIADTRDGQLDSLALLERASLRSTGRPGR